VKYAFIKSHQDKYPVQVMCRVLGASKSGYYDWKKETACAREVRRQELLLHIKKIFEDSRRNYGSPRIHRELRKMGILVNHKTVEKLMQENGLAAAYQKSLAPT
jgi:putative transposase